MSDYLIVSFLYGMSLGILHTLLQSLIDVWCNGTLIRSQQSITAALSHTILITDNRTLNNLHIAVRCCR